MSARGEAARVAELVRAHSVGRIADDAIKGVRHETREVFHTVRVAGLEGVGRVGRSDAGAESAVLVRGFFLLQDLERLVHRLRGLDGRLVQMLRDDEFLAEIGLDVAEFPVLEAGGGVGVEFPREVCDARGKLARREGLAGAQLREALMGCGALLPGQINPVDVLFELRLFRLEGAEVAEERVGDVAEGDNLAVVTDHLPKVGQVRHRAKAPLTCD